MSLSENTRVSASIATVISLIGGVAVGGSVWGIYSTRLEALEVEVVETKQDLRKSEIQLAETKAQFADIVRRLDRLDRKLDWIGTRGTPRERD